MDGTHRQVGHSRGVIIITSLMSPPGDCAPRGCALAQRSVPGPGDGAPVLGGRQAPRHRLQQPRWLQHQVRRK